MKKLILLGVVSILVSCANQQHTTRGVVAMKINKQEAHVSLGKDEVQKGDKVMAYFNDCQSKRALYTEMAGPYGVPCVKTKIGIGVVTQILNDNYSVVKFKKGVKFKEGTFIEKQ